MPGRLSRCCTVSRATATASDSAGQRCAPAPNVHTRRRTRARSKRSGARRRFAYGCMDWSERRPHLAGALGAALAERCLALGWLARQKHSRALTLTDAGVAGLRAWLVSE